MISRGLAALALVSGGAWLATREVSTRVQPTDSSTRQTRRQSDRPSASYAIHVSLDPSTRRLDGRERVRWRNASSRPVDELKFHLSYKAVDSAAVEVSRLRVTDGDRDLLPPAIWSVPDNRPEMAQSVLRVPLGAPLNSGSEISLDVQWTATLPRDAAAGDVVVAAHWFPQLAVLTDTGWVAHQSRDGSYLFTDAATFDVTLDVPDGWDVAATGHQAERGGGGRSRRFVQDRLSMDFAFAAARTWSERRERVDVPGREPVDVRLLLRPEHANQSERAMAGVRTALASAGRARAPYPYTDLTILDLPWGSSRAGDVFPSFVTMSTPWMEPARVTDLETAIARGLARHFWQHVVASDREAHRWIVDGLATYAAARLLEPLVQRQLDSTNPAGFFVARAFGGFVPYAVRSVRFDHALDGGAAAVHTADAIQTLERYLGRPTLEMTLAEYSRQFWFGHPAPEDFFRLMESTSGRDLRWFFDEAFATGKSFDYAVGRVTSESLSVPAEGYRTAIVITRHGEGVFSGSSRPPVGEYQSGRAIEIDVVFADGTVRHATWDGRPASTTLVYESRTPVDSITVDPDRILLLDRHTTNNTWTRAPQASTAATRWAALWMTWLANVLLTYSFFA